MALMYSSVVGMVLSAGYCVERSISLFDPLPMSSVPSFSRNYASHSTLRVRCVSISPRYQVHVGVKN